MYEFVLNNKKIVLLSSNFKDFKIAELIEKEGKGCLIVVNKWDTIPNKNNQTALYYEEDVRQKLRILGWAPIVYSTAIQGHSVEKYVSVHLIRINIFNSFIFICLLFSFIYKILCRIIVAAATVEKERARRLTTATLNQVIREAIAFKPPPRTRGGKRGRIYYCTQVLVISKYCFVFQ